MRDGLNIIVFIAILGLASAWPTFEEAAATDYPVITYDDAVAYCSDFEGGPWESCMVLPDDDEWQAIIAEVYEDGSYVLPDGRTGCIPDEWCDSTTPAEPVVAEPTFAG